MAERSSLVRLVREFDITVDWRGFELHPETPPGGMELAKLHPGSRGMGDYIQKFAAKFGVDGIVNHTRLPNTRRALAVAEFARDQGKLDAFRRLAMDAHWKEARDIEADSVLKELAAAAGVDAESALVAANSPAYRQRVADMQAEFRQVHTGGIPTFVFGEEQVIEGCQPYPVLAAAARRAGACPR